MLAWYSAATPTRRLSSFQAVVCLIVGNGQISGRELARRDVIALANSRSEREVLARSCALGLLPSAAIASVG